MCILELNQLEADLDQMEMLFLCKEQNHQQTFELNSEKHSDECCLCKVKTIGD